jgi:hypothetical protein
VFALLWICAQQKRSSAIAMALLVAGHLAFWWALIGEQFVNDRI